MNDASEAVRAALEAFWNEQDPLAVEGDASIDALVAAMDSFTACEALERLEELLGIELPSGDLIRPGGYDSKAQFLDELSEAVLAYQAEHAS